MALFSSWLLLIIASAAASIGFCRILLEELPSNGSVSEEGTMVTGRYAAPEEGDIERRGYVYMADGDGNLHYVDLKLGADVVPKVAASDVTLWLYTKANSAQPQKIRADHFGDLQTSKSFNAKKRSVFVVHGWNNKLESPVNQVTLKALLQKHDLNVFVVDWSKPASSMYPTAKNAVTKVGEVVGNFIAEMVSKLKVSIANVVLVGHSLGAHVAGCAGARIAKVKGKVDHIVGLDPAGPLFTIANKDNRLDPGDANFVHVIHTNDGLLGFGSSIGHADYYPNGGRSQPGCGVDLAGTCAHSRAYYYFAESITRPQFHAVLCDSHKNFEKGACKANSKSLLGGFLVDKKAKGKYYLNTGNKAPYGLGKV